MQGHSLQQWFQHELVVNTVFDVELHTNWLTRGVFGFTGLKKAVRPHCNQSDCVLSLPLFVDPTHLAGGKRVAELVLARHLQARLEGLGLSLICQPKMATMHRHLNSSFPDMKV